MTRLSAEVANQNARHVTLRVRGFGEPGQRPLLGVLVCAPAEAAWLAAALDRATEACATCGTRHAERVCPACGRFEGGEHAE